MRTKNIITVDWEDWFHICEVEDYLPREKWDDYPSILPEATKILLQFFKTHNISATFFILGYSATRFPKLVEEISKAGHELAYHTANHSLVYTQEPHGFREDIRWGKQLLEEIGKQPVLGFRAPQWSLNDRCPWGLDCLTEAGYTYDSSHAPLPIIGTPSYPESVHDLKTSQGALQEFPPLILNLLGLKVPAGGGWGLRTWPIRAIRHKIARLNGMDSPATLFIHPVEVIDFTPPLRLPFLKRLVTRFGRRTTLFTIKALLATTDFISISQYRNQIQ